MAISNNIMAQPKQKFSVVLSSEKMQNLINNTLRDVKRANRFIANISSAVAVNPDLQSCECNSIISGALLGESLNLSLSPQLGQCHLVPYNLKDRGKVAQFQIGYKGFIQLAIRSGQYKKLNVLAIKQGELVSFNALTEEFEANLIDDEEEREKRDTVGYYAMFEYINGFTKALYWCRSKMERHALKYSKGYAAKKGYTYWEKNFDDMALKTMIKQLISKWGIMSIEMQDAITKDQAVIKENGDVDYIDTVDENGAIDKKVEVVNEEIKEEIQEDKHVSIEDLPEGLF